MSGDVPGEYQQFIPDPDATGVIVLWVAHVSLAVLGNKTYQECQENPYIQGWMREGELGLFGTNALDTYPDPDGDGIILVGSCI